MAMIGQSGFFIMIFPQQRYCSRFVATAFWAVTLRDHCVKAARGKNAA
jgi:hypothetical protein